MQRILRSTAAQLDVYFTSDESLTDPDDNEATVTITKADGSTLVAATAASRVSQGRYRYTLAPVSTLEWLTLTWTGYFGNAAQSVVTGVEVVGGFYFSLAELRASDATLTSAVKYTTAQLAEARTQVEDEFESICEAAFVPRFTRERLTGNGQTSLQLSQSYPRALRSTRAYSSATNYQQFNAGDLADTAFEPSGVATRLAGGIWFAWPRNNLVVEYEHGHDYCPPPIKAAALRRARMVLNAARSGVPDRATSFVIEGGTAFRLDMPKLDATGVPDIDAVLGRYSMRVSGIA